MTVFGGSPAQRGITLSRKGAPLPPQLESKERSYSKHEAPEEEERFAGFYLSPKRDYFDFSSGNHICATAGVTQHIEHLKGTD